MKICVYCSSVEGLDSKWYELGRSFGRWLGSSGHMLVYGGYNKGIMGEVARGTSESGGEIIAVVPKIFDRPGFTYEGCSKVIMTESMHARKAAMETEADAFVILPGGIGTFDEFFELYVLKSLGQIEKPMVIFNAFGCYDLLEQMLDKNASDGFLLAKNRAIACFCTNMSDVINALKEG